MTEKFFNKEFGRMLAVNLVSQIIVLAVAVGIGLFISDKLDQMIKLSESLGNTLERVESTVNTVVGIDTVELEQKATSLKQGATTLGEGVGDGGGEIVNRVGEAWKKFKEENDKK